jgi:3',5'-cyclic AMP phosphodiesterase CpdA
MKRTALLVLFLFGISLFGLWGSATQTPSSQAPLRVGIFTDLHAHDTNSPNEGKIMTNYAERLTACIKAMNAWPADIMIELGDFVNGRFVMGAPLGNADRIPGILDKAEAIYKTFNGPRYYVIGNHDVYDLSKAQFLAHTGATKTYESFDAGAYHFVILDAQYDKNGKDLDHVGWAVVGNIPPKELDWLKADLAATDKPTIVCVHQRLDKTFDLLSGGPEIIDAAQVRSVLEASGKVIAVFQGHDHLNAETDINGIHYVTFDALVDEHNRPESWAYVTLDPVARTITIKGVGAQKDWNLSY